MFNLFLQKLNRSFILLLCLAASQFLAGCSTLMSTATQGMANNLSASILNHNDLKTVENGAPAYLLMIDSFIEGSPEDENMLLAGARLYGAYASIFVKEKTRSQRLADRAFTYARKAVCLEYDESCNIRKMPFADFKLLLAELDEDDMDFYYTLGTSWAGWIQTNRDNWNAVAELPRVKAIMERLLKLDESYQKGNLHLYMGVLSTLLPPSLGGKPEVGRKHFETAIALSKGKNLMAKVMFAQKYSRLIYDKKLHNKLLKSVIKADPHAEGLTLMNTLAQQQAKELLAGANDYF